MVSSARAALRAVPGLCALLLFAGLAGCEGSLGTSPPHAAPANPSAEGGDGLVELSWSAVPEARNYVIVWDNGGDGNYENRIPGVEGTTYVHEGLTNGLQYRYRIMAATGGGTGPQSVPVGATPGIVPGPVEWAAVTAQSPGHTIYFSPAANATHYRIYAGALESQLSGRRPAAPFELVNASPFVRPSIPVTTSVFYRVVAMNGTRIGTGGPVIVPPANVISEFALPVAGAAFGRVNDDDCLDLPTAAGGIDTAICTPTYTARVLADAGLADLLASPRVLADARFADVNGDGFDDLFSNTNTAAGTAGSIALLHVNQGNGNFQTAASMSALAIGGFGGTILAADFDNDGDVDLFAPYDQTRGDGALNRFLVNDGAGGFADAAAAAGLAANPPGPSFVPRGGQAVDFNEDGRVDLLFGSRLMLNNGDGSFTDGSAAANIPTAADNGLRMADIDLDGDLDLVSRTGSVARLYRNTGGVFDGGTVVGSAEGDAFGFGLAVCDINGDGFEDVLVARNELPLGQGAPELLVNVNGELRLSVTQRGIPADPDSLVARIDQLACGDQNNDGMADVIARWGNTYRLLRSSATLSRRIQLRIVDGAGRRNEQGRIVRLVPTAQPNRILTRVVESGSGLRAQGMYDLLVGAPWPGDYEVTVRFPGGDRTTTLQAGDRKILYADGRVEDIDPADE